MANTIDPGTALLDRLRSRLVAGVEDEKLDLKRSVDLVQKRDQAALAKDISAMANTPGGAGFIAIGVADLSDRADDSPEGCFVGLPTRWPTADRAGQMVMQIASEYIEPVPRVRYTQVVEGQTGRPLGIVTVFQSARRPHLIARAGEEMERNQVWVRRGSHTFLAGREELREMHAFRQPEGPSVTIVNFTHPLTPSAVREMAHAMNAPIASIIDEPLQLDSTRPFEEQVRQAVEFVGFTSEEWQTLPMIVHVPGLAQAAAAILSELHGRMGHFPTILRLRPKGQGSPTEYVFAELINLQDVRDRARCCR